MKENPSDIDNNEPTSLKERHLIEIVAVEEAPLEKEHSTNTTELDNTDQNANKEDSHQNEHMISNGREGQKESNYWKSLHNLQEIDLRCYIVKLRIQGCRYWV